MKPPDAIRREVVAQWLARADEDLSVARHLLAETLPYYGAIGFHAQQAAEKFLKAYLVAHQVDFPKTHDLGRLLDLVASVDGALATALSAAVQLTDYGVDVRYPGDLPKLDADDAARAVDCALEVRDAVTSRMEARHS
jgi:HEPN domain-containing protein